MIQSSHDFVQHQEFWRGGKRPRELQPPLFREGEVTRAHLGFVQKRNQFKDFKRFLGSSPRCVNATSSKQQSSHDVLLYAHPGEWSHGLKGSGDPKRQNFVWLQTRYDFPIEPDASCFRPIDAGYQVEYGRLARPVGPD